MDSSTAAAIVTLLPALVAGVGASALTLSIARLVGSQQQKSAARALYASSTRSFRPWTLDRLEQEPAEMTGHTVAGWLGARLAAAGLSMKPIAFIARVVLGAALAAVLLLLIFGQPMAAVVGGVAVPGLALAWLGRRAAQTREHLIAQLPTALATIASALLAGASLPQSIAQAAVELPPPVNDLLARASHAYSIGQSFEDVLAGIQAKLEVPALEMALAAMLVHRRAGGNLAMLLSDAAEMMRDDFRLQRDLRVATAQAKLSAQVVGALPVVLLLLLAVVSPDNVTPFFTSLLGILLFVVAAILETVGYLLVMRASTVKF